jgi:hypothetical protein
MSAQSSQVCVTNKSRNFGFFGEPRMVLAYSSKQHDSTEDKKQDPKCVLVGDVGVCNYSRAQHVSKALPHLFKFCVHKDENLVFANSVVPSSINLTDEPREDALVGDKYLVACLNGVLDMKACKFLRHDSPSLVGRAALAYFDSFYQEHYRNDVVDAPYWDAVLGNSTVCVPDAKAPTRVEVAGPTFEQGSCLALKLFFGGMFGQVAHNVVLVIGPAGSGKTVLTQMVRTCLPFFFSATCSARDETRDLLVGALRTNFDGQQSLAPMFLEVQDEPRAWLRILLNMFNANVETYVTPWNDLASKVRLDSLLVVEVRKYARWMSEFACIFMPDPKPPGLCDDFLADRHANDPMSVLHKACFACKSLINS